MVTREQLQIELGALAKALIIESRLGHKECCIRIMREMTQLEEHIVDFAVTQAFAAEVTPEQLAEHLEHNPAISARERQAYALGRQDGRNEGFSAAVMMGKKIAEAKEKGGPMPVPVLVHQLPNETPKGEPDPNLN